jgi:hypothetical protein
MTNWKSKVVSLAVPIKIMCALTGAVSYCWHISLSRWLLIERPKMVAFNWNLFSDFPAPAAMIGGFMGYISAVVLILWCQQFYRTAHFIASAASSWFVGLGVLFICLILFYMDRPFLERLREIMQLLLMFGMPFFWGLILQACARRLKRLPWRIEI